MDSAARTHRAVEELANCRCAECFRYARCIIVDIEEELHTAAAYMELLLAEHQEQCGHHGYTPHN